MEGVLIGTLPSVAHCPVKGRRGGGREGGGERRREGRMGRKGKGGRKEKRREGREGGGECIIATIAAFLYPDTIITHLQVCVYPGTKQISERTVLYQPEGEERK